MSDQNPITPPDSAPKPHPGQISKAVLLILRGPQAGEEIPIKPGANILGREVENIIYDSRVSRRHAQITAVKGEYLLTDLGSTNGTFINRQRVTHQATLQHGDMIRIGDTILSFKVEQSDLSSTPIGARTKAPDTGDLQETTLFIRRPMSLHPAESVSNPDDPEQTTSQLPPEEVD